MEATSRLVCTAAATRLCAYFVAAICRTNSNQFEFVRQISATIFCRIDNYSHVTRGDLLQQPVPATCRSDLSHRVSWPYMINAKTTNVFATEKRQSCRSKLHFSFTQHMWCHEGYFITKHAIMTTVEKLLYLSDGGFSYPPCLGTIINKIGLKGRRK